MHTTPRLITAFALAALMAACAKSPPLVSDEVVVIRARAAIAPLKSALQGALGSALKESPEKAIEVCAKRAPEIARTWSHGGVLVGRSAQRLRNPANAPRPWLGPVMEGLAKAPSGSDAHVVVALANGHRGYAEAIWLGPMCLLCHGKDVAPAVAERLREMYPDDAARGFDVGEFRGVFWAELDPAAMQAGGGG